MTLNDSHDRLPDDIFEFTDRDLALRWMNERFRLTSDSRGRIRCLDVERNVIRGPGDMRNLLGNRFVNFVSQYDPYYANIFKWWMEQPGRRQDF